MEVTRYPSQYLEYKSRCWQLLAFVCYSLLFLGCNPQSPADEAVKSKPTKQERIAAAQPKFPGPTKMVIYQPVFRWQNTPASSQGTGFFAKAPNGKTVAVSSAHFLKRNGPQLNVAIWCEVNSGDPVSPATTSWGNVGRAGTMKPEIDLRSDYLLLPVEETVKPEEVLEFDERPLPLVGERVWLPNKDPAAVVGHHNVAGTITEATEKYLVVELDVAIKLQSQSGSPFISQETGKVVGTLSTANAAAKPPKLYLTPAAAILKQLANDEKFPKLRDEVGLPTEE